VPDILPNCSRIIRKLAMTTVQIPDETAAQLRNAAQADGRTLDELAGEGLAAYLASRAKLDALRAAIDEGDASGVAEDSSLEGILADIRARRVRSRS
jgi:Arc/MetJ-type ribon-helix-helix transcriptional regulator